MTKVKSLLGALLLVVGISAVPHAQAVSCAAGTGGPGVACLHYLAAGSSAQTQGTFVAVVDDIATTILPVGSSIHHYSFKSANPPGELAALLRDTRSGLMGTNIPDEPATLWITYICTGTSPNSVGTPGQCTAGTATDVWAYLQVDSIVGVRAILARPTSGTGSAVKAELDANTKTSVPSQNITTNLLFNSGGPTYAGVVGNCTAAGNCDDQFLVPEVYAAVNNQPINVGATDIRAEDAKYGTKRATAPPSNGSGLGYGTVGSQLVGTSIKSNFSSTIATPVEFGLPGLSDPISLTNVPNTLVSIPVGEAPLVVIVNRTNGSGLGALEGSGAPAFTDVEDDNGLRVNRFASLYSGNNCAGSNTTFQDAAGTASLTAAGISDFPVHIIQREPLSGTFNAFEFTEIRTAGHSDGNNSLGTWNNAAECPFPAGSAQGGTQECGINGGLGGTNNPLNQSCFSGGGTRQGVVGSGELVSQVKAGSTFGKDTLGYAFFSFANVSSIATSTKYGYLTIDQVDPVFASYTGGDPGQPATGGAEMGELPFCNPGDDGTGHGGCAATTIWTGGNSFPHLRDGTYRAWSLLRQICDTTDNNCTADPVGASAIIRSLSNDIHNSTIDSVADFLPAQDIAYIRSHYNLVQFSNTSHSVPFAHNVDNPYVLFDIPATAGELAGGLGLPGPAAQGGDAGGCIIKADAHSTTVVDITAATKSGTTVKYTYTLTSGPGLAVGDTIGVYGFLNGNDTPKLNPNNFKITSLVAGPPTKFWVTDSAGSTSTPPSGHAVGANGTLNCSQ